MRRSPRSTIFAISKASFLRWNRVTHSPTRRNSRRPWIATAYSSSIYRAAATRIFTPSPSAPGSGSDMPVHALYNEDVLDGTHRIADASVDLVVADPPYGLGK